MDSLHFRVREPDAMGLPAAALCVVGTLVLAAAAASRDAGLRVGLSPPCSATLVPLGPCEAEGDACPFVLNLPPVTVSLPRRLLDLERLAEELRMLKDDVDELRRTCGCRAGDECAPGAERDADNGSVGAGEQIWGKDTGDLNERRGKNGKTLAKDRMEQVVAAGENAKITERKKLDGKQIERDGVARGVSDKQNSALGNASHVRDRTFGKSEVWRGHMMDTKRQTEAADEMEPENEESAGQMWHVRTNSDHPTKDQEDAIKSKDGNAKTSSGNGHTWQEEHHEDGVEKNMANRDEGSTEQPADRDGPVWRDKTHVDMNQMERKEERGGGIGDAREEGGETAESSQSGRHVWQDETMETSSGAEKIKMSVSGGFTGQDGSRNREVHDDRGLMEGTGERSGGQASVVIPAPGHRFIDLDGPVTLTSPPAFTAPHMTADVEPGRGERENGKGSTEQRLGLDAGLAGGEKLETNVEGGRLERPEMEIQPKYEGKKVDIDVERHKPTISTTVKNVSRNKNVSANFEQRNPDGQSGKLVKPPTKIVNRFTTSDSSRDVIQEEQKSTSKPSSQNTEEKAIYTENTNLEAKSSTRGLFISNITTFPTAVNASIQEVRRISGINRGEKKSDTADATIDEQTSKASGEGSELRESASENNYEVQFGGKVDRSSSNSRIDQPSATTSTPKLPKLYLTKAVKYGGKESSYKLVPSPKKTNEKASNMNTGKDYVSYTPTPRYLDVKQEQIPGNIEKKEIIQRSSYYEAVDKFKDEHGTISNIEQENTNTFNGKLSESDGEIDAQLTKHDVVNEDVSGFNSEASNAEKNTYNDNERGKDSVSSINLDTETSSMFDTSAKVRATIAEDATISTPTASETRSNPNPNQEVKTRYGQPSIDYNEKDIARKEGAESFKDDNTSTTITSHQTSPATTSAPTLVSSKKKITSSKVVPPQKPKPNSGKKPEANIKPKNPKNDHKPSPDTRVKSDRRQMHPKVTSAVAPPPAQTPPESDHGTQLHVNDEDNLPEKTRLPAKTWTAKANVTSAQDRRRTMDKEKESGLMRLIKKFGNKQNNTSNVLLGRNASSEFNGTMESSKKSPKMNIKIPQMNQKPKLQVPKNKPALPKLESNPKVKVEQAPKAKIPKENQFADLRNSSRVLPGPKPQNKPVKSKIIKQTLKVKEKMADVDAVPTSGPIDLTLKSNVAHDLEVHPLRQNDTTSESLTKNPKSGIISGEGPQTTDPVPSIALTTEPNKATLPTESGLGQEQGEVKLGPAVHAVLGSAAPPAPLPPAEGPAVGSTTPSARELRVKINQVAAFFNKSSQQRTHGGPQDEGPREQGEGDRKTDAKPDVVMLVRDCSDHVLRGHTGSGVYLVTPDPGSDRVRVLCDMERDAGGWTVLQRRHDGSVSFNRSWAAYRDGFGQLDGGEFWLGNRLIHLLTRDRSMELRVELEDFEGVRAHAQYEVFRVASERMRFRLTVDGYSGTAGDALRFNAKYNHNNRAFTTPDRDNDRYPSGNCGAYYGSGWWFDACMAANLNGRYYKGRYKGVRDGIYWGTWHNISTEYYPTNERMSFKTVRMMIRPKGFKP